MARRLLAGTASVVAAAVVLLAGSPAAFAARSTPVRGGGGGGPAGTGIDVAWPQCPATGLPAGEAFAVIGVNHGLANNYNGCLSAEWGYASGLRATTPQPAAQTYLNTGNPGPAASDWPSPAQPGAYAAAPTTDPYGACDGTNSPACAWAFGYDMVAGIGTVAGDLAAFAGATGDRLAAHPVWLDVETGNSWQSGADGQARNAADLQGMVAALEDAGAPATAIGIYSTASQWAAIMGGAALGPLAGLREWLPGAQTLTGARSNCSAGSFTGGKVALTQWTGSLDYDYPCP